MTQPDEKRFLPDRRKNSYIDLEKRLDEHTDRVERRFRRWFRNGLIAFAIIGLTSAIAIIGYGFVLRNESNQNDQIQAQRKAYVRDECNDINERHRRTDKAFNAEVAKDLKNAPNEAVRVDIRRRAAVTLRIVDAVLPIRNCAKLVELATTGGEK